MLRACAAMNAIITNNLTPVKDRTRNGVASARIAIKIHFSILLLYHDTPKTRYKVRKEPIKLVQFVAIKNRLMQAAKNHTPSKILISLGRVISFWGYNQAWEFFVNKSPSAIPLAALVIKTKTIAMAPRQSSQAIKPSSRKRNAISTASNAKPAIKIRFAMYPLWFDATRLTRDI